MMRRCPLCHAQEPALYHQDRRRDYYQCATCALVFVPSEQHLTAAAEKAEYDQHQNSPQDTGYRRFLGRLFNPLATKLAPGAKGLDFGCGPGPALASMFEEAGHPMSVYDPFFSPEREVLNQAYDFVTCTEVVEHLHQPAQVFRQLDTLVKPGGWLGIMTCFQNADDRFATWHYRRDPTHVVFYREETFAWLAAHFGWELEVPRKDVALFRKRA